MDTRAYFMSAVGITAALMLAFFGISAFLIHDDVKHTREWSSKSFVNMYSTERDWTQTAIDRAAGENTESARAIAVEASRTRMAHYWFPRSPAWRSEHNSFVQGLLLVMETALDGSEEDFQRALEITAERQLDFYAAYERFQTDYWFAFRESSKVY